MLAVAYIVTGIVLCVVTHDKTFCCCSCHFEVNISDIEWWRDGCAEYCSLLFVWWCMKTKCLLKFDCKYASERIACTAFIFEILFLFSFTLGSLCSALSCMSCIVDCTAVSNAFGKYSRSTNTLTDLLTAWPAAWLTDWLTSIDWLTCFVD